ncbi:VOC family protein [Mucilaginibacter segetis]|uniref:VOC family protein n=1 Tax=Mucilaginibacter segetis TaxID=2793071 RepID=A0A934UNQ6_9SPHI|nr:VOC family protein [Mucilaginibacter segetis]MBK0381053.1 VOC family protein [Mucilaginibacter segetis]
MQKITPFLWFDTNAEEAVNFYISLFKNSKILRVIRNGSEGPGPEGSVLAIDFSINGQEFAALNGGPTFTFTEAVSFMVNCETQEEIDNMWEKLSEGGQKSQCGWLKDKFGLSWQVTPPILLKMISDPDPVKSQRVMNAMMKMEKLIIKDLEDAYNG